VTIRVLGNEGAEIAKRISGLSPSGDKFKEFQIRPLSSVKPKHQADVWREAVETALENRAWQCFTFRRNRHHKFSGK
jgi:hypothetical protein